MKQSTLELLCCPLCKGALEIQMKKRNSDSKTDGVMVCNDCMNRYSIHGGIPQMYLSDDEIVSVSVSSNLSKFIVSAENLSKWIDNTRKKQHAFSTKQVPVRYLMGIGWILLIIVVIILVLNSVTAIGVSLLGAYLLGCMSLTCFGADYFGYRVQAETNYLAELETLKEMSDNDKLCEFDIRISTRDNEAEFKSEFEIARDVAAWKGKRIVSILKCYDPGGRRALNIGCGGELHKSVSKPYFDKGYEMIGVDISEEYLEQFSQIFSSDVVQANSMALPFKNGKFDLVNSTDLLEHLHNPLMGLMEAQRVLRIGGLIVITTNNRCVGSFRCINPLIFIEKIVGIYYDAILTPRTVLARWMDFRFYHTEFSKNEIRRLMEANGFEILRMKTQFPTRERLNRLLGWIPVLRFMCAEFIIVGRKKGSHRAEAFEL